VAEVCSWYSAITTSNLGHVFEESLWGTSAALAVGGLVAVWPSCGAGLRSLLAVFGAFGLAYVHFMFLVDVPMYWGRWLQAESVGQQYLPLVQGVIDAAQRCTIATQWAAWRDEVAWMTLYFSVAVWMSIALVSVPGFRVKVGRRGRRRVVLARKRPIADAPQVDGSSA
jgi:hypothetical protein